MSRYETARLTEAHEFDLVIGRDLTSDELDAITRTGADDYLLGPGDPNHTLLCFTRAAPTLAEALTSALGDVTSAGLGGDIVDVRCFGMTGPDVSHPDVIARFEEHQATTAALRSGPLRDELDQRAASPGPRLSTDEILWGIEGRESRR